MMNVKCQSFLANRIDCADFSDVFVVDCTVLTIWDEREKTPFISWRRKKMSFGPRRSIHLNKRELVAGDCWAI